MAKSGRRQKVADQIQRELSGILQRDLRDPRIGLVTLTGVEISPDFCHATVYYTCLDAAHAADVAKGLRHAAGYMRAQLAKRIRLFSVPDLRFVYDASVEHGARIAQLLDGLSVDGKR